METLDWAASQGEALMDPAEDEALLAYMTRFDSVPTFEERLRRTNIIYIRKTRSLSQFYFGRALSAVIDSIDSDPAYIDWHQRRKRCEGIPDMCCLPEVQKIQDELGPQGYQIKVFQAICGALWFHDPKFDRARLKLWILKNGNRFHGIRKVPESFRDGSYCKKMTRLYNLGKAFCCDCKHDN